MMRTALSWLLWLAISLVIAGAFLYAPPGKGFVGESSRILFFHVPMAWVSFVAFLSAGVWSLRYLFGKRLPAHDRAARVAVEQGLLFCVLATLTGAIWSRIEWGAYWNWDPRQTSIVIAMLFYGAYLALRSAVEDPEARARLAGAYASLGIVVAPFLFFILPRLATFSLHPEPVVNAAGNVKMDARMAQVLILGSVAFTALFFWLHRLQCRIDAMRAES